MPPFGGFLVLFALLELCGKAIKTGKKRGASACDRKEEEIANGGCKLVTACECEKGGFEQALYHHNNGNAEKHTARLGE